MPTHICLRCFYEWESPLDRDGIRCGQCHTRQGVAVEKFNYAVDRAEELAEGIPLPPNPAALLLVISSLMDAINAAVTGQFPDLLLPPRVAVEVWNRAVQRIDKKRQDRRLGEQ